MLLFCFVFVNRIQTESLTPAQFQGERNQISPINVKVGCSYHNTNIIRPSSEICHRPLNQTTEQEEDMRKVSLHVIIL